MQAFTARCRRVLLIVLQRRQQAVAARCRPVVVVVALQRRLQAFTARCHRDPLLVILATAVVVAVDGLQALTLLVLFEKIRFDDRQLIAVLPLHRDSADGAVAGREVLRDLNRRPVSLFEDVRRAEVSLSNTLSPTAKLKNLALPFASLSAECCAK